MSKLVSSQQNKQVQILFLYLALSHTLKTFYYWAIPQSLNSNFFGMVLFFFFFNARFLSVALAVLRTHRITIQDLGKQSQVKPLGSLAGQNGLSAVLRPV